MTGRKLLYSVAGINFSIHIRIQKALLNESNFRQICSGSVELPHDALYCMYVFAMKNRVLN